MKLGYKIIIVAIVSYFAYGYYSTVQDRKRQYIKEVESIMTDIRREDYFAMHNSLDSTISSKISIDDISLFIKGFKFTKQSTFILESIDNDSNRVIVKGSIVNNNKEMPSIFKFKDNNGTISILSEKIGTKELVGSRYSFPITANKK